MRRFHTGHLKNTANTNLLSWQGRLYALMEGAKPTRIDPDSLETIGETDLGVIPGAFSAHPHRVEARKCTYNFGLSYGVRTTLDIFSLPDAGDARLMAQLPLEKPVMLHDFAATQEHLVFFVSPLNLVLWRMLLAVRPFQRCFAFDPSDGAEIIVVPIDAPSRTVRFKTDAFMQFHFAGAFEAEGKIAIDYVRYEDATILYHLGDGLNLNMDADMAGKNGGCLHRAWIDPRAKTFTSSPLWEGSCEFPQTTYVDGHASTLLQTEVLDGDTLHTRITRIDAEGVARHHTLPKGCLCSEPVPAGTDTVTTLVFDSFAARSHLLLLDARSLEVQARIMLSQAIPLTFHGQWVPSEPGA